MSRIQEYVGPGIVLKDGTEAPEFLQENNIKVFVFELQTSTH